MRERKWLVVLVCVGAIALTLACSDKEVVESNNCLIDNLSVPGTAEIGERVPVSFYLTSYVYTGPVTVRVSGSPAEVDNNKIECVAKGEIKSLGTDFDCAISFNTPGNKTVTVSVNQKASCSISSSRNILINPEGIAMTSLSIGSDRSTNVLEGDTVTLYGWVSGRRKDNAAITGSVTFNSGNNSCNAQIVGGKAECGLKMDTAGSAAIHAAYSGDQNFLPSTADVYWIVKAASKIVAAASPNPAYSKSPVTLIFTVSKLSGSTLLIPTGEVLVSTSEFRPDDEPFHVTLTDGSGSIAIQFSEPNPDASFTLVYLGDTVFDYSETTIKQKIVQFEAPVAVTGCMVADSSGFHCVAPCPDPNNYPEKCTP